MKLLPDWLRPGDDRALAATVQDRQQAKQRARRQADIRRSDRAAQAWEEADRRRFGG